MAYDRKAAGAALIQKRWAKHHPEKRFWDKIDKQGPNGCWIWKGARTPENYGTMIVSGKRLVVSRFAYELLVGKIPPGNLVCHRCDNPPCCNPDHLFCGTSLDNVTDCISKGRNNSPKGCNHFNSKIDEADVRTIFNLRDRGLSQRNIAEKFGFHQCNVSRILNGKRWKHVK